MKCRVCGAETNSSRTLCSRCHEEIELLSTRYTDQRGKINLDFNEHHFFSRDNIRS